MLRALTRRCDLAPDFRYCPHPIVAQPILVQHYSVNRKAM